MDENMKVAIIGNRKGWSYNFVRQKLKEIDVNKYDTIISGGAYGVDIYAQLYAREIGAKMIIYYPDPEASSPERYYQRNSIIVSKADKLIAFNKGNNQRTGTWNAIRQARELGLKPIVFTKES